MKNDPINNRQQTKSFRFHLWPFLLELLSFEKDFNSSALLDMLIPQQTIAPRRHFFISFEINFFLTLIIISLSSHQIWNKGNYFILCILYTRIKVTPIKFISKICFRPSSRKKQTTLHNNKQSPNFNKNKSLWLLSFVGFFSMLKWMQNPRYKTSAQYERCCIRLS